MDNDNDFPDPSKISQVKKSKTAADASLLLRTVSQIVATLWKRPRRGRVERRRSGGQSDHTTTD